MCNQNELQEILHIFSNKMKDLFGEKLKQIVLFGSYARGDYDNESDIDVMVLVDMDDIEISKYHSNVVAISSEIDLAYEVVLTPIIQNNSRFMQYIDDLPFYRNVKLEGVVIGA